jgi:hypothetical protein
MPHFTEPEEIIDYLYNVLETDKGDLGLGYVGYGDERLLPQYPAVVVSYNAPTDRTLHATRHFRLEFSIQLVVYHAKMSASHKTRTREDMQLAAAIRNKLHEDKRFGGGVIFGYVASERPGVMADDRGEANVATMMIVSAESRQFFE